MNALTKFLIALSGEILKQVATEATPALSIMAEESFGAMLDMLQYETDDSLTDKQKTRLLEGSKQIAVTLWEALKYEGGVLGGDALGIIVSAMGHEALDELGFA